VADKPDGRAAGASQRVAFTRAAADRIARVVRASEAGDRSGSALTFRMPPETMPASFRIASFGSAAWTVDTAKVVTLFHVTNTPNTVSASNVFGDIGTATSTARRCAIALDGTAWYVIQARCP
jgi:hypothetical protein